MKIFFRLFVLVVILPGISPKPIQAQNQELNTRFGLGFNAMLSTADGIGIGVRGRASAPVTMDLSLAVDLGVTGFTLGGRDDASYVFDPQVSAIVTMPVRGERAPYLMGGFGAYVPFAGGDGNTGPTLHGGIGWVRLFNDMTIFYEINPALILGKNRVDIAVPARLGLIF